MPVAADRANAFLRCLLDLDVETAKRLWAHVSPHLPQPESDHDMLATLHMARLESRRVPVRLKKYSRAWLKEHSRGEQGKTVGIAVGTPPWRRHVGVAVREAMEDAVYGAIKAGIDIDDEAAEVKARMMVARDKEFGRAWKRRKGV